MHRSLFEPDYSSTSTFPRCSVVPCHAIPASRCQRSMSSPTSCHRRHKHVQFSLSEENQVYWIQRRGSQKLPVRTEGLLNHIAIILLLIQKQREELQVLGKVESELNIRCNELIHECERAGLVRLLDAEKAKISLEARLYRLNEDIGTMCKDTLQLKRTMKELLSTASQRLRDQDAANENNELVFSKRIFDLKDVFMMQIRSAFASEELRARAHISSPESNERTARCA